MRVFSAGVQVEKFKEILVILERVVVIAAATLAIFPLWQYWVEAPDRERERQLRAMQLTTSCLAIELERARQMREALKARQPRNGTVVTEKERDELFQEQQKLLKDESEMLSYCRIYGFKTLLDGKWPL